MRQINIVVPCYNEAKRIPLSQFVSFAKENPTISFTFVDDGSTDHTKSLLETACASLPSAIRTFSLPKNSGKAEAVRQGMLCAMESDAKIVGFWDADLATPLSMIHRLVQILAPGSIEVAFGSRVKMLGRHIKRNKFRHYLGRLFASAISMIFRLDIYDSQCGAKLFRNSETLRAVFHEPFYSRWIFDVEILERFMVELKRRNLPQFHTIAVECPVDRWEDIGLSKVKTMDYLRAAVDLFWLFIRYRNPLNLFSYPKSHGFQTKR